MQDLRTLGKSTRDLELKLLLAVILMFWGVVSVGLLWVDGLASHEPCHHDEVDARREGSVNVYTTMPQALIQEIAKWADRDIGFLKIRIISFTRLSEVVSPMNAGEVDVIIAGFSVTIDLKGMDKLYPCPPDARAYPSGENRADKEGYWTAFALTPRVLSYNTTFQMGGQIKSYKELVGFKNLKGNIIVQSEDDFWYYGLKKFAGPEKGKEIVADLRRVKSIPLTSGMAALEQIERRGALVAVGLNPWSVVSAKEKGSPVDYAVIKPVVTSAYTVSGAKTSTRPNAGRAFIKFLRQESVQERLVNLRRYVPANRTVPTGLPNLSQEEIFIPDPSEYVETRNMLIDEYHTLLGLPWK